MKRLLVLALMLHCVLPATAQEGRALITTPPAVRLDLAAMHGHIRITGWEEDRVEVRFVRHPGIRVEVKQDESRVEVRIHRESRQALIPANLEIRMPSGMEIFALLDEGRVSIQGFRSRVEAGVEHGDITASDLAGEVIISSTTGDIRLTKVSGALDISATSGVIVVEDVEGDLEAETIAGDIRVQGSLASRVHLTSNHGTLTYHGTLVEGGVYDLATQSGAVDFRVPTGTGGRYEIGTVRGRLESSLPFERDDDQLSGARVTLTLEGVEAEVKIITFSGDIKVFDSE